VLEIRHSNDAAEIERLATAGYEPIECSIDGRSLVGPLEMDHHGERSHLEGVAVRAYRDHRGARVGDARFVVTGDADADATFAIAALAGLLPDPGELGLSGLADLIQRRDTDPLSIDLNGEPWAEYVLLFDALSRGPESAEQFVFATLLWRQLLRHPPPPLLEAARREEGLRIAEARSAEVLLDAKRVRVVASSRWGFDVWYARRSETAPATAAAGWARPVVLAFDPEPGSVVVGCPNPQVAAELFGPRGLLEVFPQLEPPGWGGREAVGGSRRGMALTREQVLRAAQAIGRLAQEHRGPD